MRRLKLMMKQQAASEPRSVDAILGAFLHYSDGGIYSGQSSFFYTSTVSITAGQTISWYGKSGAVCAAIFYYDGDGTFGCAVRGVGSSVAYTYSWTATVDCEVGICGSLTDAPTSFTIDNETITINY